MGRKKETGDINNNDCVSRTASDPFDLQQFASRGL